MASHNNDQKNFAKKFFLKGYYSQQKVLPEEAEAEMQIAINPRTKQCYPPEEWLTRNQFK